MELREVIARAIWSIHYPTSEDKAYGTEYRATDAALDAIAEAGFVIAPREPTEAAMRNCDALLAKHGGRDAGTDNA